MAPRGSPFDPVSVLTLGEVRRFIRASHARGAVVFFGLLYVLGALFESGMVAFGRFQQGLTIEVLWSNPTGEQWWNYPGVLVIAPWGVVSLPFFPTVAMLVVGVGVGFGMTVAFLLTVRLLRPSAQGQARSKAVGALTGLTPAMISLVTLGACCSTTAAATAGVGLVADASATSVSNLLLNNWYLGVFQIVIVWTSLVAQELLLTVYGGLFGRAGVVGRANVARPLTRTWLAVAALRVALLVSGVLWALGILVAWTTTSPAQAPAVTWAGWLVQHELVGSVAVALALFPLGTLTLLERTQASRVGRLVTIAILIGAVSSLLWYPGGASGWAWSSLPGEILGTLGVRSAWGGVTSDVGSPLAVGLRWASEYLLLALVVSVAALWPARLRSVLARGVPQADGGLPVPPRLTAGPAASPDPGGDGSSVEPAPGLRSDVEGM